MGAGLLAGSNLAQCDQLVLNLQPFFFSFFHTLLVSFFAYEKLNFSREIMEKKHREKTMKY